MTRVRPKKKKSRNTKISKKNKVTNFEVFNIESEIEHNLYVLNNKVKIDELNKGNLVYVVGCNLKLSNKNISVIKIGVTSNIT